MVTSVSNEPSGAGNTVAGEPNAGELVGSVEGALAAEALPAFERPDLEPAAADRPVLRVAPDPKRGLVYRRRRAQLLVLSVAALSAASMFLLVTFHVFAAQSAFTLDKLQTQLATEQRQYGLLRNQVATLSSPEAVASGAQQLGMVRAPQVTLLHPSGALPFGSTVGLPVPPPIPYNAVDDTGQ
jgi:cell division protein FtsL